MTHDDATIERVARAICEATSGPFEMLDDVGRDALRHEARAAITAYLSAMPERALLREALEALQAMLWHSCVADADAEDKDPEDHDAERRARAAADKICAALTQEKQT